MITLKGTLYRSAVSGGNNLMLIDEENKVIDILETIFRTDWWGRDVVIIIALDEEVK